MWTKRLGDLASSTGLESRAGSGLVLRTDDGLAVHLPVERWAGEPTPEDRAVLARAEPPVIDVGCGPGRLASAIAARGEVVLGIDVAPNALRLARARGCAVLERSVFDDVPGAGRYASALLVDGNVGIGGDPGALLARVTHLLGIGGHAVVEVEQYEGLGWSGSARLEWKDGASRWFPWARVDVPMLRGALDPRLALAETWRAGRRRFVTLRRCA